MSILGKIFGTGASEAAGGVAGAVTDIAGKTADIVERWHPSEAAKQEMRMELDKLVVDAQAAARSYDPRTEGTSLFAQVVNVTVDALSRLIRPFVTVALIGACVGWWNVAVATQDPIILGWTEVVVGFWFGYRAVSKDIPSLIVGIRKAVRS